MRALFESVPDFDQPVCVLTHCHDRIRKQLDTMQKLVVQLLFVGMTDDARYAAKTALRYFDNAAPDHHADEEQDLLPMLLANAQGDDLAMLNDLIAQIADEHNEMEALWKVLAPQLRAIATGQPAILSAERMSIFVGLYRAHMQKEEAIIVPMAQRLLSAEQLDQLADAMRVRRGINL